VSHDNDWVYNYYNYFTEIEEHFQKARGTSLFLLSTLDWALIETWKNADVPLEAVLRGIDAAFEKWHARKSKTQMVNSLAFCAQAVMLEAQVMTGAAPARAGAQSAPPFPIEDLRRYFEHNSESLRRQPKPYHEIADALDRLTTGIEQHFADLEELERRLTALEDKMIAVARAAQTEEQLLAARRELDRQLRPYRGKMSAEQLAMLEKQYLERELLERADLPRLSLFYLR
jgi:septal ring factor EnvC (AmiA/AmiB activator)